MKAKNQGEQEGNAQRNRSSPGRWREKNAGEVENEQIENSLDGCCVRGALLFDGVRITSRGEGDRQ